MSGRHSQQGLGAAVALHKAGRLGDAAKLYRQILDSDPNNPHALHYLGIVEASAGNLNGAKSLIARSIEVQPSNIPFLENYATILSQCGDHEAALRICQRRLEVDDKNVTLLYVSAVALYKLKRLNESISRFDKLLGLKPDHVAAINERGSVLADMNNCEAALESFRKVVAIQPEYAEGNLNLGNIYGKLNRHDEALASYDKALALDPALAEAWLGRGNVLVRLRRYDEASAAFDQALTLRPAFATAWLGRGNLLTGLRRYDDALAAFDRALAVDPNLAEAWGGRGSAFVGLKHYDGALAAFDRALALNPDLVGVLIARANVLVSLGRREEAFAALDRALGVERDGVFIEGARLHAKMQLCEWSNLDREWAHLKLSVNNGIPQLPFGFLAVTSSAAEQMQCAKLRNDTERLPLDRLIWRKERYNHDRIRVAYLSGDFGDHPVAYLVSGVFEHHDRSSFEMTGLSFGPEQSSPMRQRISGSLERFVDVRCESDDSIAQLLRRLEIDIAVDLVGFTGDSRPNVFARRPAPLQVNYLGYPGTMGADYMDYIIADRYVIPEEQRQFYTEKVIYLPNTFQANDSKTEIGDQSAFGSRAAVGLPESAFVFCAFNSSYKITPAVFDVWMRLLRRVADSVLWLVADNAAVERNLRKEAAERGVDVSRLVFAPKIRYADYLARFRLADLFLDTLPFNAGATASDALRAGLPLVTCSGEAFASRMAGSLLRAVGMPELITDSMTDYEALAAKLACDPELTASIRMKLERNRLSEPLFDTERFTRHLEAAYVAIYDRAQTGFDPDHIVVEQ
jgi:protein O-GlcNAc transferase